MSVERESAPQDARNARDRAYASAMRAIESGDLTYPHAVYRLRAEYGRVWSEIEAPVYEWKREHDKRLHRYEN